MDYCKLCGNIGHKYGLCTTDTVDIIFRPSYPCHSVELFTSVDKWQLGNEMTHVKHGDYYIITKGFPVGEHQFKFRVDYKDWVLSSEHPTCTINGLTNNFLKVHWKNGESVIVQSNVTTESSRNLSETLLLDVRILLNEISLREMFDRNHLVYHISDLEIEVWGSWDNWAVGEAMNGSCDKNTTITTYTLKKRVKRRIYNYKFKVNGIWMIDPYREAVEMEGIVNHVLNCEDEINFDFKQLQKDLIVSNIIETSVFFHEKLRDFDLVGHSLTTVGGKLFMFGGKDRDSFTNNIFKIEFNPFKIKLLEVYDSNGPSPIGFHKAIKYGEKLIIYGGHDNKRVSASYHTYSTLKNTWTSYKIEKPLVREMYSVVYKQFTSRIYIFGGLYCSPDDEAEIHFNDLHVLFLNLMRFKPLKSKNAPSGRFGHSATIINWTMFIFGGCRTDGLRKVCFNDLYKINLFDHDDLVWEEIKVEGLRPAPRYAHLCVQFGTQMMVYGGYNDKMLDNLLGDFWVFEIVKGNWMELKFKDQSLDYRRAFHAGSMLNNSLIVFGGKLPKKSQLFDKFLKFDFEF